MRWRAVVMVAVFLAACSYPVPLTAAEANNTESLPPLVVDKDNPLLLEESGEDDRIEAERVADNSACLVCHANYDDEPIARWHAWADIGCIDCHGISSAHQNDENNTTPPDAMFPRERIEHACKDCHEWHVAPAKAVIETWLERAPRTKPDDLVCTDCHGEHRLKIRTVTWDKKTRKLLKREAGPPEK
jgi:hypothetical protein